MKYFSFLVLFLSFSIIFSKEAPVKTTGAQSFNKSNTAYIDVVAEYGVIPNDGIDDSYKIQQAISDAKGSVLYFRAGTYVLERPLHYSADKVFPSLRFQSIDNAPGLKIIGEGINNTIFINRTNDYAIKVLGVRDEQGKLIPRLHQTSGYFKDFSIYSSDKSFFKPKGGIMLVSTYGFKFENVSILGAYSNEFTKHGIYVPLVNSVLREVGFANEADLNRQFEKSFHTDFINPDSYSSWGTTFTNLIIDYCKGYGLYGANGVGFNFRADNIRISRCNLAGIFTTGHHCIIKGGSIFICGSSDYNKRNFAGGIIVDILKNTPNNLEINNVEFHDNYPIDIDIRACANAVIHNNKFITTIDKTNGTNYRVKHIGLRLGGFYYEKNLVRNISVSNNFFRYQNEESIFTSIELNNFVSGCVIENNASQPLEIPTKSRNRSYDASFFDIRKGFSDGDNYVTHKGKKVK